MHLQQEVLIIDNLSLPQHDILNRYFGIETEAALQMLAVVSHVKTVFGECFWQKGSPGRKEILQQRETTIG
jgi:hypothetical protein